MKYVPTVVVLGIIVLLGGIRLLYLGPFGIRPGDNVLLAHSALGDRCDFYAIGRRTEYVTEPWGVTLYKVESDHRTSHYYLAFEDSYWWGCSIRSNDISHEVEIQANGKVTARYLPA